ncbi:MAG: hypothetical protein K2F94_06175 [Muribaculaceae bacterium]|nr:hypothetical protein [Muribaculaceae bacterium]MDE6771900.1 hypothetical protein [Muribaculaceae bacterium]
MNKEELNGLLDSIYELEGLVHLAIARDDNPDALPELISRKGEEMAARAKAIASHAESSQIDESVMEPQPETISHNDVAPLQYDESESSDDTPESSEIPEDEFPDDKESIVPIESDSETEDVDFEHGSSSLVAENPTVQDSDVMPVSQEPSTSMTREKAICEPRGRLVFSINDRYRFKRELFGNSDADFNNTLALVASMESYDETEDYFLGELQWNPQREEVIDFLEILKKYHKA